MLRLDSFDAFSPAANAAHRPAPHPAGMGGSGFSALFREIHDEVREFIEIGSPRTPYFPPMNATALGAHGQILQAAMRAGAVEQGEDVFMAAVQGIKRPEQQAFLESIAPFAKEAGLQLGVDPVIIAAHAALESGWGQRPLRHPDGSSTHNLFGIKAGPGWSGQVVNAWTTEYEQGMPQAKVEPFRSFPDHESAFRDFVRLIKNSPRYRAALNTGNNAQAYADALVRGGYATDPAYARKLTQLATRMQSGG